MAQDINNFIDPKLIDSLTKINEQIIAAGNNIDSKLLPAIKKLIEVQDKLGKENKDTEKERKKLTAAEKEAVRIAKQYETTEAKIISLQKGATKLLTEKKLKLQELTAAEKEKIKTSKAHESSLVRMRQKLKELTTAYDNTGKRTKEAATQINRLSKQIEKAEKATNRHGRGVGGYANQLKGLAMQFAGALGLTSLVFMFVNVLKGSFNTIREFTKQNAVLSGVLGKTRKEITQLTNQAINLGSVYPVTASEVNKLQVSFARLGFTQAEIINLTEATILGSIALNSELDATATLVGAVVKAYQDLGTEDAGEIIDKLTLATQKSSLSFSSLETALPKVASAASAMNVSLSETLTHLGIINDATLDASITGTSYRNILLELAKRGITLNEALSLINNSSNKLTTSFDLFGKRGAIAGLALANAGERAIEFKDAVDDAGGTTERVAEEQMATLDGSIKGLSSSWEKFILGFKGSEGIFRKVIDSLSLAIDTFSNDSISSLRKLVEFMSIGIIPAASKIQKRLDAVSKNIANASVKDLEYTIKVNGEKLKNGSKTDKLILDMLKNRLQKQKIIDISAAKDASKRAEIAKQDAQIAALAKTKEASEKSAKEQLKIAKQLEADINKIMVDTPLTFEGMLDKMLKAVTTRKKTIGQEFAEIFDEFGLTDETEVDEGQDDAIASFRKTEDKKLEILRENAEIKKQNEEDAKQMAIDASIDLGNFLFDQKNNQLQREFAAAEGNAEKQAEISRKIAQQEKKQALFNVAINTAVAVSKVWGQTGIFGLAAQIPVLVMGALQAGLIAAQPIPQFEKGTNYAPGGVAELAERGSELVKNPSGKIWLAENRGLYNLERGSKVMTHSQTVNEMNDKNIVGELRLTRKAIQRMPRGKSESQFTARQRGYNDGYRNLKHRLN